jgi:Uma2 family endonuclease
MNAILPITVPERAKLRAQDFMVLADAGAFDRYAKSELIEGEIWVMNAVHSWHAKTMAKLGIALGAALKQAHSDLELYMPVSIAMSGDSVPEPDLAVAEDNEDGLLPLAKVRLAIEVSDTSLAVDLGGKAMLYARHGVPEYWVVDRDGARIVQHWHAGSDGYSEKLIARLGEPVESTTIAGLVVDTTGI